MGIPAIAAMLPDGVDAVVEKLKPAEISLARDLLEGVACFDSRHRQPAQQRSFNDVPCPYRPSWEARRIRAPLEQVCRPIWRKATPVRVNESLYLPLPKATTKAS